MGRTPQGRSREEHQGRGGAQGSSWQAHDRGVEEPSPCTLASADGQVPASLPE